MFLPLFDDDFTPQVCFRSTTFGQKIINIMKMIATIILLSMVLPAVNAQATDNEVVVSKDSCFYAFDEPAINGTTGTPLGGFGCGGIKYDASKGTFSSMTRPPADAFDFKPVEGAKFTIRVGSEQHQKLLKARKGNDGLPDDDAIWPLHYVNMGSVDNIDIHMEGISPLDREFATNNMHLPYSHYEFTLTNHNENSRDIALALTWRSMNRRFKIAGDDSIYNGIYNDEWSIIATGNNAMVSGRTEDGGTSGSTTVNFTIAPGEVSHVRFVIAWYNREDTEIGYYMNLYDTPYEIACHGMNVFDRLKDNAENLVIGMRASSLPNWLKNQTLNTLASIVINSMLKKDGRVAFAEGQWTCFGTMDQMWLARQIIYQLAPEYAWREVEYWASTQMQNGQIHHDFNVMDVGDNKAMRYTLVDKNDSEHQDYRNIQKWVDLNCAFIISVYEGWQATGDRNRLTKLWQNVKRAAQRILDQTVLYGHPEYPYTFEGTENSYDAGGNPDPYNTILSAVAYRLMSRLADEMNESEVKAVYQTACEKTCEAFHNRYLRDGDSFMGKHCESVTAGQALALHLRIGEIMDYTDTGIILDKLDNFYYPYYWGLGYPQGTYDEWTPYILTHYGGLMLNTGQVDRWYVMQKDAYMRQYLNRDKVFAHPLNILPVVTEAKPVSDNHRSKMQYISLPAIWRNYYDIIGFHRDESKGELWLTPIIAPEIGDSLKNVFFTTPYTSGTISAREVSKNGMTERVISMTSDNPMKITSLHLRDDFQDRISIAVNGITQPYRKSGTGYARELIVELEDIFYDSLTISVEGIRQPYATPFPAKPEKPLAIAHEPNPLSPYETLPPYKADKLAGIKIIQTDSGEKFATSCNNFDYILFLNLDFARPDAQEIIIEVRNPTQNTSEIEVVLDDTSGPVIGTCKIPPTDREWETMSFPIKKTRGIHNTILRFFGSSSDNLMELKSIHFK